MSDGWMPLGPDAKPFGSGVSLTDQTSLDAADTRMRAIRAIKSGRATPEQRALVAEADAAIQAAIAAKNA